MINETAFLAMWNQNMSTRQISSQLEVPVHRLNRWMQSNGYNSAYKTHRDDIRQRWHELYQDKNGDKAIATATGQPVSAVIMWRIKNKLPPNQKARNIDQRIELWAQGNDTATIAKELGETYHVIYFWKSQLEKRILADERLVTLRQKMMLRLYNMGFNDDDIAVYMDVSRSTVQRFRKKSGLETHH